MQAANETGLFRRLVAANEARRKWEAANPELAAAWSEAMREDHERTIRAERAERERDVRRMVPGELRRMGVPYDAVMSLDMLNETPPVQAARKFLAEPATGLGRFLVLLGPKGAGKTVAAAMVLAAGVAEGLKRAGGATGTERDLSSEFVLSSRFARASGYDREDRAWFERLLRVRWLVLDDFGAEHLSDYGRNLLDELLMTRHGDCLRTVITTNLDKKAFAQRVGERLFDRISTSGMNCTVTGDSLRKRVQR